MLFVLAEAGRAKRQLLAVEIDCLKPYNAIHYLGRIVGAISNKDKQAFGAACASRTLSIRADSDLV